VPVRRADLGMFRGSARSLNGRVFESLRRQLLRQIESLGVLGVFTLPDQMASAVDLCRARRTLNEPEFSERGKKRSLFRVLNLAE
jgi:hypothetical protein